MYIKCPLSLWSLWLTLGSICPSSLAGQKRWCVMLDHRMLKLVLVPSHRCACPILSKFIHHYRRGCYCDTINGTLTCSNHDSDDIQHYLIINVIQFNSWAVFTQHQIPLRYTSDLPIPPPYQRCFNRLACLIAARFTVMNNLCNSMHGQVHPSIPSPSVCCIPALMAWGVMGPSSYK